MTIRQIYERLCERIPEDLREPWITTVLCARQMMAVR